MSRDRALIQVDDVSFHYAGDGTERILALDRVSLTLNPGEFVGIIGQNGSGKTTLARHLNGLLKPASGRVLVDGRDTRDVEPGRLAGRVGYVFQNPDHALFLPSVREELEYSLGFQDVTEDERQERVQSSLEAFGLQELAGRHPASLGRGYRRLVVLAAAFAMSPTVLVLDEPTGGLDHRLTADLMATLQRHVESGGCVVLISHNMQLVAENCRRVLALDRGRLIADGDPGEVFLQRELLDQTGLRPPDIGQIAFQLQDMGMPADTVTMNRFVESYRHLKSAGSGRRRR